MELFIVVSISYLMGSIPFGYIFTKIFLKKDIRDIGSGNIGTTNVLRTGNKFIGYSTLMLDILKAVIPVLFTKFYLSDYIFISALSVFIGHVFPIWLKFKGGKGVATYVGILFCINYLFGFIFVCCWLIIFFITKYSSLSSILASISVPVYIFFFDNFSNKYFYIIMFILIFYNHRENIIRLINQEESKTKIN
ncbi:MAG: glycerol-3-phosphate 1-O-acyltransferase PlsY [Candidatus Pelagibacter bacterium]|jgi:glycerol-3-phosphate acyltransferase PlsY|nr:glycerol-3-phosphate 1-O-acyltransferase PlsY [Candidatus Pelagibacter bacterium]|tara:strand:+ start:2153 stop:2731 length:579 start_codon:yes stop_codon:yes gene_type:complete